MNSRETLEDALVKLSCDSDRFPIPLKELSVSPYPTAAAEIPLNVFGVKELRTPPRTLADYW